MKQRPSRSTDGADSTLTSGNPIDPVGNRTGSRVEPDSTLTSGNPIDPVGNVTGFRVAADPTSGSPIDPVGNKQRAKNAQPRPAVRGANGRGSRVGLRRSRR